MAALPAPLRLARGLAESLVGRLSGEMLGKKKANPLRLIGPIAKGGFGTIYDARDGRGGRVAVKVMETEEDFGQFPRFTREFEQLRKASSQHPNIIRCFDQGNDIIGWREYPWYSMEFAAGGDLARSSASTAPDSTERSPGTTPRVVPRSLLNFARLPAR